MIPVMSMAQMFGSISSAFRLLSSLSESKGLRSKSCSPTPDVEISPEDLVVQRRVAALADTLEAAVALLAKRPSLADPSASDFANRSLDG